MGRIQCQGAMRDKQVTALGKSHQEGLTLIALIDLLVVYILALASRGILG